MALSGLHAALSMSAFGSKADMTLNSPIVRS